jgi:hypothetical protein
MYKTLLLISMVFVLSSCASSNSKPESVQAESDPAVAQVSGASGQAAAVTGSETGDIEGQTEIDGVESKTDLAAVDPTMEEVEVEGFKEKKHCTHVARTGSRIKTKYCRTVSEDEQQREAARAWLNEIKTRPQGVAGQNG